MKFFRRTKFLMSSAAMEQNSLNVLSVDMAIEASGASLVAIKAKSQVSASQSVGNRMCSTVPVEKILGTVCAASYRT